MKNIDSSNNSYNKIWCFFEDNLPNYYGRDDVLRNDILYRFYEGEQVCDDDLQWIEEEFHGDKQLIAEELKRMETVFFTEALDAYYSINTK